MICLETITEKSKFYLDVMRDSIWRTVIALDLSTRLVMRGQFNCAACSRALQRSLRASTRVRVNGIMCRFQSVLKGPPVF